MNVVLNHIKASRVILVTFSGSLCGFSSRVYGSLTMTLTAGGVGIAEIVPSVEFPRQGWLVASVPTVQ